jgi:hypothetical protein
VTTKHVSCEAIRAVQRQAAGEHKKVFDFCGRKLLVTERVCCKKKVIGFCITILQISLGFTRGEE